jgi:hypothetical protein
MIKTVDFYTAEEGKTPVIENRKDYLRRNKQ